MTAIREKLEVTAEKMVEVVKNLIHEGNVRKLIIRQGDRTELPLAPLGATIPRLSSPL